MVLMDAGTDFDNIYITLHSLIPCSNAWFTTSSKHPSTLKNGGPEMAIVQIVDEETKPKLMTTH